MTSQQGDQMRALFPRAYATRTNRRTGQPSMLGVIIDGAGTALDALDPAQTNLAKQFSVSGATGSALDQNGADWQTSRLAGETDDHYRTRILAAIQAFASGLTPQTMINTVAPFTGTPPLYSERGSGNLTFPLTFPFKFGGAISGDSFTIDLTIQNPNGEVYNRGAVIAAIQSAKRKVAIVIVHWEDGTTTQVN